MEFREFAGQVLALESIAAKLAPIGEPPTDASPGQPVRPPLPARPPELRFCQRRQSPAMPRPGAMRDPRRRAVAHHIMANHELLALEVMAFVLCAFPDAPPDFRRGLVRIMADEQRHTRWHLDRLDELGLRFGEIPVNGYIWTKAQEFRGLLDYLAGLPLMFEGRNLDHTLEFADQFAHAGDDRSAGIMRAIHRDEIGHVAFGLEWLRRLKPPEQSDWDAFESHLNWPLRPGKARGKTFNRAARLAAGMTPEFIDRLEQAGDDQPHG